jgi:hypothetical protein
MSNTQLAYRSLAFLGRYLYRTSGFRYCAGNNPPAVNSMALQPLLCSSRHSRPSAGFRYCNGDDPHTETNLASHDQPGGQSTR